MIVDATEQGQRPKEFIWAEKAGVKPELVAALNEIIKYYDGKVPKSFGVEEFYFMMERGMKVAGVEKNFEIKSLMLLARAFIHGFALGKVLKDK